MGLTWATPKPKGSPFVNSTPTLFACCCPQTNYKAVLSAKSSDDDGGSRIVFSSIHCKPPPLSLSLSSLFFVFILIINYYSNTQCNSERKLKPCRSLLTFFLCFSSIIFLSLGPKFVWDPTTSL